MTVPDNQTGGHYRPALAMGLRLGAALSLTVMLIGIKMAAARGVSIVESLFYRQLFAMPIIVAAVMLGPGLASLRTNRIGFHLSRAGVGLISMVGWFVGAALLPLADMTTVSFSVPIFATILSAVVLREATGWHRWVAVIIGFCGVIVLAGPASHGSIPVAGMIAAIVAAFGSGVVNVLLRQLGRTEPPATTVFWFTGFALVPLGLALPFFAKMHDPVTFMILAGIGIIGGVSQLLLTTALKYGPVSLVLPMDYSGLLWATLAGVLLWDQWPGPTTWLGAVLIVGSGLYIAWRERIHHLNRSSEIRPY